MTARKVKLRLINNQPRERRAGWFPFPLDLKELETKVIECTFESEMEKCSSIGIGYLCMEMKLLLY